jgi:hypothetical protein
MGHRPGGIFVVRPSKPVVIDVGGSGDGDEKENAEEFGTRTTHKIQDPKEPNMEEVEEHNKTHLPFISWCRHCVRGRGKKMAHYKNKDKDKMGMHEVHFDFFFMGMEGEPGRTIPIVAVKERKSGMLMA